MEYIGERNDRIFSNTSYIDDYSIIGTYLDITHWTGWLSERKRCASPRMMTTTCKTTVRCLKDDRAVIWARRSEHAGRTIGLCLSCFAGC